MNRRKFISQSAFTTAGIGMASVLPSRVWASEVAPSDSLNVALIGCRGMGFGILKHHLSNPGINCVALCDIDDKVLMEKASDVKEKHNQTPRLYKDFRKMLEQKDIDAVIIGTPDHWHCLMFVNALQAGKHVYVEKPMANSIAELDIMVKAAGYYKKTVQVGQQQRSGFIFKTANQFIKEGRIGNLRKVNMWANFAYGVGPVIVPDEPVPAGVDYDMWLGPAPERPFNKNRFHGSWRHFWDYGSGMMSDWGVHLLDMGLWTRDILAAPPKTLVYAANTIKEKKARETYDSYSITYPKDDFVIHYDVTAGPQRGPWDMLYGIAFVGDDATLVADRSKLILYPERDKESNKFRVEEYQYSEGKESHGEHVRNFIDCIKSGEKTACPPEIGRAAAIHAHIANIAGRTGESMLLWDDATGKFTNSEAANALITPAYRQPWTLPKI
jgi:predicted dehydrogenase